ncbi:unnamed protein product [Citrullus colocynthis]|uniref:Peptidase A1 domain-containing protein n=1 Tax=Citrullus colocynthis TaxID=252529 RepID=A0ABP0YMS1_9ROSI
MVNYKDGRESGGFSDAMCSACEMAVSWMQDELKQNETQEHIIDYVNEYILKIGEGSAAQCTSGFQPVVIPFWIFGDIFMGRYHTVFDFGKVTVGFADAA